MRPRTILALVVTLVVILALDFGLERAVSDSSLRNLVFIASCNVLVALSLNIINGLAGQFSIGHAGFVGLGAYTAAIIAAHLHQSLGGGDPTFAHSFLVMPLCLVAAGGVAGLFGLVVGLPSLRLKGDYLAIVTLGFAEIFRLTISTASLGEPETVGEAWHKVHGVGSFFHVFSVMITSLGGQNGYSGVSTDGLPLYAGPFWVFGVTILFGVFAWRLKFSGWGRALRALREDEIAAGAVGVDPTRYKVTSFVLAAVGAGVAGCLMALMRDGTGSVNPDNFGFDKSFEAITMVILGGSGSVTGAVLGGLFVTFTVKFIEFFQSTDAGQAIRGPHTIPFIDAHVTVDLNALRMIIYAALLIAIMIWRPEGLLGERELFARKRKPAAPAGEAKA